MKLFFKTTRITLVILGIFIVIFLIFYYPIQHFLDLKDLNKYITSHDTNKSNIKSIRILKNYKQDVYYMNVFYFDDPELKYEYKWYVNDPNKKILLIFFLSYLKKMNL